MDDVVLFDHERARLRDTLGEVEDFLRERLRLVLRGEATILAPVAAELSFHGWRIHRDTTRLRPESRRRTRRQRARGVNGTSGGEPKRFSD